MNQNPYKLLATMVDAVEKMALLPQNEVINNQGLVAEKRGSSLGKAKPLRDVRHRVKQARGER